MGKLHGASIVARRDGYQGRQGRREGTELILVRRKSSARISVEELVARALVCAVGVLVVCMLACAG